ncbi:phosphoglycolate phosphatase [Paramicrobacterium humi]|uniref:Phosphoglycolate phosphatase n=1 Tax=Paramicrobacterium humi TaxID=640635 RepID=A0A1H4JXY3_9MICO|nr:HAD hydrolase-like protein [Microbacterium humi]SEB51154.1 phosphoglycolate phosphatase [Microbacterium humi]
MTIESPSLADAATAAPQITRTWSCILFDLDGTITDSAPGIVNRIFRTLEKVGRPAATEDELLGWVGPPMLESLENYGFTPDEAVDALGVYRSISEAEGPWAGSAVYPGLAGLIARIKAAGVPVAVASSKPEYQVTKVLSHFGLIDCFDVVCGASADESVSEKADVIALALKRLQQKGVDTSHSVYIGDRSYDVEGATAHGIPSIIVEWGYGSPAEAEGAMAIVHSVDTLGELLLG